MVFREKKVAQCDIDFNVIAIYNSYNDAAKAVNGTASAISRICSGTNQTHKGFRWKIVEEMVKTFKYVMTMNVDRQVNNTFDPNEN